MNMPLVLSVREAAQRAGVPEYALRRWIAQGSVHAVKSGRKLFVTWGSLVRFLSGAECVEGDAD